MDKTFKQKLEILPIKNIEHPVGNTKYYAAVHVKSLISQADEEFQELKEQHGNQAESILLMLDEIKSLKSQLQQQALPVVPECVGEFVSGDENELSKADRIAYLLKSVQGDSYYLTEELPGDGTITVDEGQELYNWAICQHHETILKLWNGYTVEKPQLFYLKSKSLLENEGESEESDVDELYLNAKGNLVIYKGDAKKFTQSEIDSMQTESYEQIEVTE
ncbi:DUF1642 domain-containing protein [Lactococcus lactis]|uniref:DUF1642 domain-containing protein n=1 Tax=Lactococcus lactis TaxID=1358 RepID=UPI0018A98B24|nr:DUF1642 domain-containing protein [Lactococcus lactis]